MDWSAFECFLIPTDPPDLICAVVSIEMGRYQERREAGPLTPAQEQQRDIEEAQRFLKMGLEPRKFRPELFEELDEFLDNA